jgi:hypothetical protein
MEPPLAHRTRPGTPSVFPGRWARVRQRPTHREMTATTKAGRYQLLEEIGRGAMGVVYRATDPLIGRTVAVKTLNVSEHSSGLPAEELLRRFQTEARAAGLLSHPNIVAVYDAGKEDDFFYITMELVQGKSLQALIGERRAFPLARVLRLMQQACSALDFAHRNNVIHRDIKPANLILTPDDTLKISDFGTAKIMQFNTTQTGQIVGTPSYMSPEQIKGRPVDGRSDIFSLGGVLYELLTGVKPFPGDSITSVIYKIVSEEPKPPREMDRSIHPGLSAVVLRALAKTPEARFQSCVQFFDALQNYREYQPSSYPGGALEPAGRFVAEASESTTEVPESLLPQAAEPAKSGNSLWLAALLLCVIGAAGYKVWPPLRDLWLRTDPIARMPGHYAFRKAAPASEQPDVAPAAEASSQTSDAAVASPESFAVPSDEKNAPLTPAPAKAAATTDPPSAPQPKLQTVAAPVAPATPAVTSAAAPAARTQPEISEGAAQWREHVVRQLADAGIGNKVKVVAAGSTVTLSGKLDTRSHRTVLQLLRDSPSSVQVLDHIEDTPGVASPQ